jgi:hypothetical protein
LFFFSPQLMLEFPQRSGPQVTMTVRVTDEYVCAFKGPPPDGKVTCRAVIGVEDFAHIYSGKASAAEIGQMVFGGRVRVPGWKFRELASFATSFDFSYESWDNYYRLKPHADFDLSKRIAPTAFACSHAFAAASRLVDGPAQPAPLTIPDKIIALVLEPRIASEQLTLEAVSILGDVREKVLAVCDETVDDIAAVAKQVYWDIARVKLLPKSCRDLIPPFAGVDLSDVAVSPLYAHIARAVDEALEVRKKASGKLNQLRRCKPAAEFVEEWAQKARLIWEGDVQVHKIVPLLEDVRKLAVARATAGWRGQVAAMEPVAAVQSTGHLPWVSLGSRADIQVAHKALRPMLAYFTTTPSRWVQQAVASDTTRPVLPAAQFSALDVPQSHDSGQLFAALWWLIDRPLTGPSDSDFSDWWNARPHI